MSLSLELTKQIRELAEKANKYDNVKQRYYELAEQLRKIRRDLDKVIKELDPAGSVRRKGNWDVLLRKIAERIMSGESFSVNKILITFGTDYGLDETRARYLYSQLKEKYGFLTRKTGRGKEKELYAVKEE